MKITGYKKITHKKWLNLFEVAYVDKNGQPKTWEVVSRKTTPKCITGDFIPPDAVVIVPFHRTEKKMVIIREYRVALAGFEYSLPAGLIDKEESIETASCRELKEETGLDITEILKISPPLNATAGMTDENFCMVYCQCEGSATADGNEGTETIETILVSPEDAAVLLADTKIRFDVKLWLELSRFAEGDGIPAKE
ncbi:MAG: NUDIX hydrolase [Deltaproteobacteria bacterium]|nr:NUDIX hydrolase [Deltaproteobacteria bacterium]MBW2676771.1 NUDIX hydrolase [Deltaproteobacteria bacterium]